MSDERPGEVQRVLSVNSHQPYVYLLGGLPHEVTVIDKGLRGFRCDWDRSCRPLPERFRLASLAEATVTAQRRPFDVGLAHNVSDLLTLKDLTPRQVLLLHGTLQGRIAYEGASVEPDDFCRRAAVFLSRLPVDVIFISELKRRSWTGIAGRVLRHGLPLDEFGGYDGREPAVLRVANLQHRRDALLNHTLQEKVVDGIPNRLIGYNPGVPGSAPAVCWEDLKAAYRAYRCFLVTNHPVFEDGFNLAMLEAMATGMPVVTSPHPTSPVRHGENGLVGRGKTELRAHVRTLLQDRDLALALGAEARRTVAREFPYDRFLAAWDEVLRAAAARPWTGCGGSGIPHLRVVPGGGPHPAGDVRPETAVCTLVPEGPEPADD